MATGLLLFGAPAQAAPTIPATTFSNVTTDSATLEASLDPNGTRTFAHFAYIPQQTFEASGFDNALHTPEQTIQATVKGKGELKAGSSTVSGLTTTQGTFAPGQTIKGEGIPEGATIIALGNDPKTGNPELVISSQATADDPNAELTASGPQPISAQVTGLAPATQYRFRLEATNTKDEAATGTELSFYTLGLAPTFEPCPNDIFRSGGLAPLGHPSARLPDCRAYEQATPVNKNGGDVVGDGKFVRAADDGSGITFGSTFGVPGSDGAQYLPFFLGSREAGEDGWSTQGLLPPADLGQAGQFLIGWLPDFSSTFASATRLGEPRTTALFELNRDGTPPTQVTPYVALGRDGNYSYAGASADGSTVIIEAPRKLAPIEGEPPMLLAKDGASNVYAWDKATGRLHLASAMNSDSETEAALAKGAFAGPYDWNRKKDAGTLRRGGASALYYTQEERAVSEDGSVFFTAAGTGQLYQRLHPTAEQSKLDSEGNCTQPEKACTIQISASKRTDCAEDPSCGGDQKPDLAPDSQGAAPAAFQAASADGKTVFFTSSEELTDDANTGPPQPPAQIGSATLNGEEPPTVKEDFLPAHALGLAVDPKGEYIYWADPIKGTIGRAQLNGDGTHGPIDEEFIVPGQTSFETHPESEPGVIHSAPGTPRYVAVDDEYVYWTNTGPLGEGGFTGVDTSIDGAGTIGRARIDRGSTPEPEFITGASDPQGIAVDAAHIYWSNAGRDPHNRSIGRAEIGGGGAEQGFRELGPPTPTGMALKSGFLYFGIDEVGNNNAYVSRIQLPSGKEEFIFLGNAGIRGVAVDNSGVFWATQDESRVGRVPLSGFSKSGSCATISDCEATFLQFVGKPLGIATGPANLYWSVNGDSPGNPGNDLYRYEDGQLEDLTSYEDAEEGAEVRGVLGAAGDGSSIYFVANGDLDGDGPAEAGNCSGPIDGGLGNCSLYRSHDGNIESVARMEAFPRYQEFPDALNWASTPQGQFGQASFSPRSSLLSSDGRALIFRSSEKLTDYDNHGTPQFYRFEVGGGPITCATCNPSGIPPSVAPTFGTTSYPSLGLLDGSGASTSARFFSDDGNRAFFETSEALVTEDTNGLDGCPPFATPYLAIGACQDVYEWEAPGTGTCTQGGPAYSPLNEGCLYLLSSGKGPYPSFLADASASGDDVFFFTRDQLVRQDTDSITDVYDVRAGGGLAAQNQLPVTECEGDLCKPSATPPPPYVAPPSFNGPTDPKPKRCKPTKKKSCKKKGGKGKKHKHNKRGERHRSHRQGRRP